MFPDSKPNAHLCYLYRNKWLGLNSYFNFKANAIAIFFQICLKGDVPSWGSLSSSTWSPECLRQLYLWGLFTEDFSLRELSGGEPANPVSLEMKDRLGKGSLSPELRGGCHARRPLFVADML